MTFSKMVQDFNIANPNSKDWVILWIKWLVQRQFRLLVLRYCVKVLLEDHIIHFDQLLYIIP